MRVVIAILWFDKIIGVIILALSSRNRSLGIHQLAVWVVCATMQGGRNNFWNIARAYTWSVKRVVLQYSTVLRAGCLEHHLPSIVGMRVQPLGPGFKGSDSEAPDQAFTVHAWSYG